MNLLPRGAIAVALAIAVQLLGTPPLANAHPSAQSEAAGPVTGPVGPITPVGRVDGMTGGEILGQLISEDYERPNSVAGPLCEQVGLTGKVLFAHRRFTCTVPEGTPVLINGAGYFCDNVEPPPDFGADEAAQRACAHAGNQRSPVVSTNVSIDGGKAVNIYQARFELYSPQMAVVMPPDNFLGLPPGPATFVINASAALVRHLAPGLHDIQLEFTFSDGTEPDTFHRSIEVVRSR
jgi:hypothetical protein